MNVLIVAANASPVAVFTDRRAGDAKRIADAVGGVIVGPFAVNPDIPPDVSAMHEVEMTKDGKVRKQSSHGIAAVLLATGGPMKPGWSVEQTPRRWRLRVRSWAKTAEEALAIAKSIFLDVQDGRRQRTGTL